ncbi:hypothetical protein [Brachybacterium epidermidis]|uniref:hypothetical protein n=1 Tax=Brachybacterium epidermidis TaxID=2781983 RepID=UPI00398EF9DE
MSTPPPPAPGHGPHQQYPGQWYGHAPPPTRPLAPTTALFRLGMVYVALLLLSGVLDGGLGMLARFAGGSIDMMVGLLLSIVSAVITLAAFGVGVATVIVGIIAVVRMSPGRARTGALLIVLAALIGMAATSTSASGDGIPEAVLITLAIVRGGGTVLALGLGVSGLALLSSGSSQRLQ